ncbi:MAG: PAS domain S-box protein [Nitrospirae bacterium]|nr:PAS domain S-box protein [Nitrospirota bacterium]
MQKTKCWELLNCKDEKCPAYQSKDLKCWLILKTRCKNTLQNQLIDKLELCPECSVFKLNANDKLHREFLSAICKEYKYLRENLEIREAELENANAELSHNLIEITEALEKISSGDPDVRISEKSNIKVIQDLKHMINLTAMNVGEIVQQSHELAMALTEHFDVLHKVTKGDLNARVTGASNVELADIIAKVTNEMIESISGEINKRQQALSLLSATLESTADGILVVDRNAKIASYNRKFLEMWNIPDDIISTGSDEKALSYVLPQLKEPALFLEKVNELYSSPEKKSVDIIEFKDGRIFERYSKPQKIGEKIVGRVWSFRDISERVKAEKALKEIEALESSILSAIPHAVVGLKNRIIIFANNSVEKVFGWKPEELIGQSTRILYRSDKEFEEIGNLFYPVLQKMRTFSEEFVCRHKSGEDIICRVTASVIGPRLEDKKIVVSYEDITESKKLAAQLIQAQKMEAVGTLAGGVAHDFNNILTAILSYANLILMKISTDNPVRKYVNNIILASEKAAALTKNLLTFSRKQIIEPRPVNINEIINNIKNLIVRLIGEEIELKINLPDEKLIVFADPVNIEQVLMNLASNAKDAISDRGIISIKTEVIELDNEFIRIHGYGKPGKYVLISFSDTGEGMDEKTRSRIFEPFFTTKEVGKGTGLGLAMSYGIIKQHDGFITCYSEKGKGTTFKIYLPLINVKLQKNNHHESHYIVRGHGTILIAEDNEDVRKSAVEILVEAGYKVIEAIDGEDAIKKYLENRNKIDLLLLDVVMPKKNGKEVYESIKLEKPDIKVIFTSGYTYDIAHKKGVIADGVDLVIKPFVPNILLQKINETINRK